MNFFNKFYLFKIAIALNRIPAKKKHFVFSNLSFSFCYLFPSVIFFLSFSFPSKLKVSYPQLPNRVSYLIYPSHLSSTTLIKFFFFIGSTFILFSSSLKTNHCAKIWDLFISWFDFLRLLGKGGWCRIFFSFRLLLKKYHQLKFSKIDFRKLDQ